MKEIELIIVRHGKTQWNQSGLMQGVGDSPLLAESKTALKKIHINYSKKPVIFSSDLGRAMSTARGIANKFPATIVRDKRLRERYFGIIEGHSVRREPKYIQYQDAVHNRHLREEFNIPGAEQIDEMVDRMQSWLGYIKRNYADNSIILVCHGEWTRVFLNLVEGREPWEKGPGIIPNATPIYKTLHL
jgi:probable phosphoglycerate mutase